MAEGSAAKEFRLKQGGTVTVHDLEGGNDELENRFPRRVKIAETAAEVVWAVPSALVFQDRTAAGRVKVYVFERSENATKLMVEIVRALVDYEIGVRRRKAEEGTGGSGVPPVSTVERANPPKRDSKKEAPVWHRLPRKQLKA